MERTPLKILVIFAAFWCLLVGVAAGAQLHRGWLVWDVHHRFAPARAVVLASAVEVSTGSEGGSIYRPVVRYRYRIDQRDYESDRYDLAGTGSSSDRAWSEHVVAAYPPGAERAMWYDPAQPESAVIATGWPRNFWFICLFLQPFLVIGAALIAGIVLVVRWRRARRRCLAGDCGPGWCVPGWGTCTADDRGLRIGGGHDLAMAVGSAAATYGGLAFLSVFPMALLGGYPDNTPWGRDGRVIGLLFGAFLTSAILVGVRVYRRRLVPALHIDPRQRRVTLRTDAVAVAAPWSGISGWGVLRTAKEDAESGPSCTYAVTLGLEGSAAHTVLSTDSSEVAVHVAERLAAATAAPCLVEAAQVEQFKRDQRRSRA